MLNALPWEEQDRVLVGVLRFAHVSIRDYRPGFILDTPALPLSPTGPNEDFVRPTPSSHSALGTNDA
jgi:hypothetical protein